MKDKNKAIEVNIKGASQLWIRNNIFFKTHKI
jgi:hypothetical protein